MAEKKRVIWIELLRIVACFGVIVLHMGAQHFRDVPVDSYTWAVSNIYHGITRFAVGCFIMISGMLYLDKKRTWNLKKLFLKNILPIAVAYAFWQLFYAVYRCIVGNIPFMSVEFIKKTLIYVSERYFHLWYLPMLIGLLIMTPLLWEIVNCENGKKWEEYIIVCFFIFKITVVSAGYLPLPFKTYILNLMKTVQPDLMIGYVGYYVLGHYLSHYELPKKLEKAVYVLGVVGIIAGIGLCYYFSLQKGKAVQSYYENYTVAAFFWCSAMFLFFKNYVSRIQWKSKAETVICTMGGCTFGIYLIHAFFINVLKRNGIQTMLFNEVISIPLLALVIFVLCYISVRIVKKIPVLGKWIV